MTLRIITPAPLPDVLALFAAGGLIKPLHFRAAMVQWARSETIGFYDGAELVAAVMLYPCPPERAGEDLRELAFVCRPGVERHLVGIVHHARLTRAHLSHDPALRIRAHVRKGHFPGQRLARLIGLQAAGEFGAFERWEWQSGELRDGRARNSRAANCGRIRRRIPSGKKNVGGQRRRRRRLEQPGRA